MNDWRTAPISEKLRAALGFLVKLTDTPERIGAYDVALLREQGITDRAIVDATYICIGFNIINRIADAVGFKLPPAGVFTRGTWFMRRFGYQLMSGTWPGNNGYQSVSSSSDPYDNMRRLQDAVFSGPGTLDATLRQAAGSGAQLPGALGRYVSKVAQRDYKGIDIYLAALRSEGYSEDQIFEATVSSAVGAGVWRLQVALQALHSESSGMRKGVVPEVGLEPT